MDNFFDRVPYAAAREMEQLSRLAFDLREQAKAVLRPYGVAEPDALLELIRAGSVAEHPAYEHFLSARMLADTRAAVRGALSELTSELAG